MELKEVLKQCMPHIYKIWHMHRVNQNKRADIHKKKAYDKYGNEILADLFEMVINKEYDVSCYYGTLLGLIRDDCLIPWDDDLDFIILDSDSFSWDRFEKDMIAAGFWKYRTIERDGFVLGQSYKKKDVLCDFTLKEPGNSNEKNFYGGYQIPDVKYVNGEEALYRYWECIAPQTERLIEIEKAGTMVKIPSNYEEVLTSYYGENWKTPDPNFVPDRVEISVPTTITYH